MGGGGSACAAARISRGQPTDVVLMDAVPQDFGASVLR